MSIINQLPFVFARDSTSFKMQLILNQFYFVCYIKCYIFLIKSLKCSRMIECGVYSDHSFNRRNVKADVFRCSSGVRKARELLNMMGCCALPFFPSCNSFICLFLISSWLWQKACWCSFNTIHTAAEMCCVPTPPPSFPVGQIADAVGVVNLQTPMAAADDGGVWVRARACVCGTPRSDSGDIKERSVFAHIHTDRLDSQWNFKKKSFIFHHL